MGSGVNGERCEGRGWAPFRQSLGITSLLGARAASTGGPRVGASTASDDASLRGRAGGSLEVAPPSERANAASRAHADQCVLAPMLRVGACTATSCAPW